jgi:hypothetical protein
MRSIIKNPTLWIGIISLITVLIAVSLKFYREINTANGQAKAIKHTHKIEPTEQVAHSSGNHRHR